MQNSALGIDSDLEEVILWLRDTVKNGDRPMRVHIHVDIAPRGVIQWDADTDDCTVDELARLMKRRPGV